MPGRRWCTWYVQCSVNVSVNRACWKCMCMPHPPCRCAHLMLLVKMKNAVRFFFGAFGSCMGYCGGSCLCTVGHLYCVLWGYCGGSCGGSCGGDSIPRRGPPHARVEDPPRRSTQCSTAIMPMVPAVLVCSAYRCVLLHDPLCTLPCPQPPHCTPCPQPPSSSSPFSPSWP